MSSVPIDHGGLAGSGRISPNAYAEIKEPEEATRSGEYRQNREGIRTPLGPIGPVYNSPPVRPII
jgi:hypothetical protein